MRINTLEELLKVYGISNILKYLIAKLKDDKEDYLIKLRTDLQTTLDNYNNLDR